MIFKIGEYDFTRCVIVGSASINNVDVPTATWKDGNGVSHRSGIKTKAMGSIELHMRNDEYLEEFRTAINTLKNEGGHYPVTAYINNIGADRTFNAFLTATPAEDFVGERKTLADFSITVEEI